jgi:hypothetical protein
MTRMNPLMLTIVAAGLLLVPDTNSAAARRYHPARTVRDATTETLVNMVAAWAIAYSACKTSHASDKCTESEQSAAALKQQGWCFGETDQVSVGFRWRPC